MSAVDPSGLTDQALTVLNDEPGEYDPLDYDQSSKPDCKGPEVPVTGEPDSDGDPGDETLTRDDGTFDAEGNWVEQVVTHVKGPDPDRLAGQDQ